jgi:acyl-CoA synthetase
VSGVVHCIDFDGTFLWTFKTDGHIFSSFLLHQEEEDCMKILFGCHDKKLRCLKYSFETASIDLEWETETQSQIYGTPKLVTIDAEKHVVSCSTCGFVNFFKLSTGSIEHSMKLPGEVFSTPVIFDRTMFIGCRDNFLYCVKF